MGFFSPHYMGGGEINGGFLLSFPFQYFVSCGVFISWVVANKAHLIETSIYYQKVLVQGKKEKKKVVFFFLLEISQPHIRCVASRTRAAWNEIWLNVFNALSVIKVLGDFISVAVSEGAVGLSLAEWFKVAGRTCRLTGWDSSGPRRASGARIPWHSSSSSSSQKMAGWESAAWTGPLQTAKRPPFTNIFL